MDERVLTIVVMPDVRDNQALCTVEKIAVDQTMKNLVKTVARLYDINELPIYLDSQRQVSCNCFVFSIIHIFFNFLIHYNQHHLTKTIETCIIRFLEKFVWERSSDKSTTLS